MFSRAYHPDLYSGEEVLLDNPQDILNDPLMLWTSSFWRYMTPKRPAPSVHAIVTGFYIVDVHDEDYLIESNFAATTLALTGRDECTETWSTETAGAMKRAEFYLKFLEYFGLETETGLECGKFHDAFSW